MIKLVRQEIKYISIFTRLALLIILKYSFTLMLKVFLLLTLKQKTMDTATVLEIIKMINVAHTNLDEHLNEQTTNADREYLLGGMHQLSSLSDNLQSFIEGQHY